LLVTLGKFIAHHHDRQRIATATTNPLNLKLDHATLNSLDEFYDTEEAQLPEWSGFTHTTVTKV